jgi:SAM-dependent MidA family methyltransferase
MLASSVHAIAHQTKLLTNIEEVCQQNGGQLSFADFMALALYAPGLGYYSAGLTKLGLEGDFVTAPMISPLFSHALGSQCQQILKALGMQGSILELGAGTGCMASDIMHFLAKQNALPKHYFILEVSGDLRERQQTYLQIHCQEHFDHFIWLDSLPKQPFKGIILGNEVVDALPCHLFKIGKQSLQEGFVRFENNKAELFFAAPLSNGLLSAVQSLQERLDEPLQSNYTSEVHLQLNAWIASLSACLEQGVILFIDYGFPSHEYYHPSRHMGTLMCHYRHHAHADPLQNIGLQDITAHVDFTALAIAGIKSDLALAGFTHQGAFLINNGITEFAQMASTDTQRYTFSQQIQKLTHSHEMGELFKVMAFSKELDEPLQGFAIFDQRHRL